jgi:hypothetical protein
MYKFRRLYYLPNKFRRFNYSLGKVIKSIIASVMYRRESFLEHYHGPEYMAVLQDYDNVLRNKIKHTNSAGCSEVGSYYDARELLFEELEEHNLKIWE